MIVFYLELVFFCFCFLILNIYVVVIKYIYIGNLYNLFLLIMVLCRLWFFEDNKCNEKIEIDGIKRKFSE